MKIKLAINGFGRIGRNVLRAIFEQGLKDEFDIVAINDLADAETNAHLLQYDTVHGKFGETVTVDGNELIVGKDRFAVSVSYTHLTLPTIYSV